MSQTAWLGRTGPTGGGVRDLDAISQASLTDKDYALVCDDDGIFRYYLYDASATDAEYAPLIVRPDDYSSSGVWKLATAPGPALVVPSGAILTGGIIGSGYSQDATDPDHDINFAVGSCTDSTNSVELRCSTAQVKQLDVTWAAGSNAGGLFAGTIAANTVYNLFRIMKDSDGSIDHGFDTSETAANIPTGYTKYRWLGYIVTDSSSNIVDFIMAKDKMHFYPASNVAINSATAVPASFTAVSISSWIPSVSRVSRVLIGVDSSGQQAVALSFDGTNTFCGTWGGNTYATDSGLEAWKYVYTGRLWLPVATTDIYWSHGGAGASFNANLLFQGAELIR